MEVAPDPRVGRIPDINTIPGRRPAVRPTRIPPNILQGIGNIPGLNLDFSKLPKNIDFSNLDPRAINANPQGFQDMIERAKAQEGLQGSLPVENSINRLMPMPVGNPVPLVPPVQTAAPAPAPLMTLKSQVDFPKTVSLWLSYETL